MPELPTIDDIKELREHYDIGTPMRRICDYLIAQYEALSAVTEVTENELSDD